MLLNISYQHHVTNEEVCSRKNQAAIREYDDLLTYEQQGPNLNATLLVSIH